MAIHLDKTWQEIHDAIAAGKIIFVASDIELVGDFPQDVEVIISKQAIDQPVVSYDLGVNYLSYGLLPSRYAIFVTTDAFICDSPDDYPVFYDPSASGVDSEL